MDPSDDTTGGRESVTDDLTSCSADDLATEVSLEDFFCTDSSVDVTTDDDNPIGDESRLTNERADDKTEGAMSPDDSLGGITDGDFSAAEVDPAFVDRWLINVDNAQR